jgi:hypothetical protein
MQSTVFRHKNGIQPLRSDNSHYIIIPFNEAQHTDKNVFTALHLCTKVLTMRLYNTTFPL